MNATILDIRWNESRSPIPLVFLDSEFLSSRIGTLIPRRYHRLFPGVIAFWLLNTACLSVSRADGSYHFLKEIPVGGEGGWDYLSVDEAGRRLYVSHGIKVVVIDLDKETVVGEIADTPGIHGVAIAHDLNRGFTSNGRENKAGIVDLKTLETLSK